MRTKLVEHLKGESPLEANTTTISIISIAKWLFPSLIGSLLAVWYKRNDIDWKNKTTLEKFLISFIALGAIIIGVVIGMAIANSIIVYTGLSEFWYQFGLYILCGLSSLKILDAVVKNTDQVISKAIGGILRVIDNIIDKLIGK